MTPSSLEIPPNIDPAADFHILVAPSASDATIAGISSDDGV
ncbi:MAG: hypothetical protein ACHQ51_12380 [Elusimicrobiota bacterium]